MTFLILTLFLLPFLGSGQLSSSTSGSTLNRWNQFLSKLVTTIPSDSSIRVVHSSGGASGGVVSEGQGYGIFLGAATAVALGKSHSSFTTVVSQTYSLFLGWKKMCTMSTGSASCQTPYCGGDKYPCLPHWKFDDNLGGAQGTGSAPDGDEDAILGMILLLLVTESSKASYSWWNEVRNWAYFSCKQFIDSTTSVQNNYYMLKLGACWGGWDCNNPSYHSPGHYRAMRNFMARYSAAVGKGIEGNNYKAKWNNLISTSYKVLLSSQCSSTGLVPNWYVPNKNDPSVTGTTGCSGSGTPSDQFGSEASRAIWRVAVDFLLFPSEAGNNAGTFLTRVVKQLATKYNNGAWGSLSTGCLVKSIHNDWTNNAFLYGPLFTALVYPVSGLSVNQQTMLNSAGTKIAAGQISDYYSGAWTAISTLTINGDLVKSKSLLAAASAVVGDTSTVAGGTSTDDSVPIYAIVGIVMGSIVLLLLVVIIVILVQKNRAPETY